MGNKDICLSLVKAETEGEVIDILDDLGYWNNPESWRYYGDRENNYSVIGNQQASADTALVEKIINSVDAVLMRECLIRGIDPEGTEAPQSIVEASEEFFEIKFGVLTHLNALKRSEIAQNINLVATGTPKKPCYSIIDKGEGQTPKKMPETLLSLTESNKQRIPFVQGKFNMGSTGSLRFCGKDNLQLLISKRHPNLNDDESANHWGFTLIRKEPPIGNMKSSTFRYLVDENNNILTFKAKSLPLIPGKFPNAYEEPMEWGTFIKLYEYDLRSYRTLINLNLNYRLALLLPNIALPVRLYERRDAYTADSYESTLSGLSVRLDEDQNKNIEKDFPSSDIIRINGQEMRVLLYVFKKDANVKNYKKNEGIIFTINGQSHGHIKKSFFKRTAVGMSYLADSIFIIGDCSNFDRETTENLFMNSRDRLLDKDIKKQIEKELEILVKNHAGLRALREKRRREELNEKLEDSKPLKEVIENIIKKSPTLYSLFITGNRINHPFNLIDTGINENFEGKEFPTYFKLLGNFDEKRPKSCPINKKFRLKFETDAKNDYFSRDSYPGEFEIECHEKNSGSHSLNLWNGLANLNSSLPHDVEVGEILKYSVKVCDEYNLDPFLIDFFVKVDPESGKNDGKPGKRVKPPGENGDGRKKPDSLDMPHVTKIYKEDWEKREFNDESALSVIHSGEDGYDFYINMDNKFLHSEIKNRISTESDILKSQYEYGMVLIGLSLLNSLERIDKNDEENELDIDDFVRKISSALSPMLLPMIKSLGEIGNN